MNDRDFDSQEITHREVTAVVKWFNVTKGFGFVQLDDGAPDAFLHVSVVERSGNRDFLEGTTIICDLMQGRKGLQVAEIHRVESAPAAPPGGYQSGGYQGGGHQDGDHHAGGDATEVVEGTVKFFNTEKGFGFVIPDNGSKDVFVSGRTLERYGLNVLEPNQRVRLQTRMGQKGPMAEHVELL
ncbi:cold-shock protein [Pelagibius litoralis]|uniref:Cold-shock protein n=1 Tax=Pelagibius litoralis TaxID=374515 RepID=A0A967F151_9PROT|nr:cold-shock protein [Pelagibius litoralis]NIA71154.1 cold-shock protein [Pelagibius litoralis]